MPSVKLAPCGGSNKNTVRSTRSPWYSAFAFAILASVLTLISQSVGVTGAGAAAPLTCDGETIYIQDNNGNTRAFDTSTKTLAGTATVTGQKNNALGIGPGGTAVYTADNTNSGTAKAIRVYNRTTETYVDHVIPASGYYTVRGAV
ncbi:MAG: hypothetical protein KDA95_04545, partial [Acidimicrobiales bacterium]|nr:hypothetical protein [Acidimicrobiales bacterium]